MLAMAVGLEMRGLVDETPETEPDVFEAAASRMRAGAELDSTPPVWADSGQSGIRSWMSEIAPALGLLLQGVVYGAATLFVFFLLWFSDLSRLITPAGGVVVALAVYVASAGWSRLMSVYAGGVIDYSRKVADYFLTIYYGRAVFALILLVGGLALAYAVAQSLTDVLGPFPVLLLSMANLTLFWLTVALVVAQRKAWLGPILAVGAVVLFLGLSSVVSVADGWRAQAFLGALNVLGLLYVVWRSIWVRRDLPASIEEYRDAIGINPRRGRSLFLFGIGYGFLILSDYAVLAVAGYFEGGFDDAYLAIKLVSIMPLVLSLGAIEVLERRLSRSIDRQEGGHIENDPTVAVAIRRAFVRSLVVFGAIHAALGLATATLLLPGMPFGGLLSGSAVAAQLVALGFLSGLGVMFAVAGVSCTTLLGVLGEDRSGLGSLTIGIAVSLVWGAALYPVLGVLGPALGMASGAGVFLVLNTGLLTALLRDYPFLSYRKALE